MAKLVDAAVRIGNIPEKRPHLKATEITEGSVKNSSTFAGSNPALPTTMKKKVTLTEEQAKEMYYNINSYFLFLQCAENVDKVYFDRLKFWNPVLNNHLARARRSVATLMAEFNKAFRAVDEDKVLYDTPSELYRAMEMFSRMPVEKVKRILDNIENNEKNAI